MEFLQLITIISNFFATAEHSEILKPADVIELFLMDQTI